MHLVSLWPLNHSYPFRSRSVCTLSVPTRLYPFGHEPFTSDGSWYVRTSGITTRLYLLDHDTFVPLGSRHDLWQHATLDHDAPFGPRVLKSIVHVSKANKSDTKDLKFMENSMNEKFGQKLLWMFELVSLRYVRFHVPRKQVLWHSPGLALLGNWSCLSCSFKTTRETTSNLRKK